MVGNCKIISKDDFPGKPLCYVQLPSNCTDHITSPKQHGLKMSAEACKHIKGKLYFHHNYKSRI